MMNINLRVAFLTMRAALKPMIAARRGRIVAVGSRAAVEASPNIAAYAVSKAALVALVKNVAAENRELGITANVVLPSTIDTPANRKAMPKSDFSRWVAPESIAKLLVWLASDEPRRRERLGDSNLRESLMRKKLTDAEISAVVAHLPGWSVQNGKLHREYKFADFPHAFGFMATAAPSIEKADHHPEWSNVYNLVVVDLNTHDAGGITQKDVDLAALLEGIATKLA